MSIQQMKAAFGRAVVFLVLYFGVVLFFPEQFSSQEAYKSDLAECTGYLINAAALFTGIALVATALFPRPKSL